MPASLFPFSFVLSGNIHLLPFLVCLDLLTKIKHGLMGLICNAVQVNLFFNLILDWKGALLPTALVLFQRTPTLALVPALAPTSAPAAGSQFPETAALSLKVYSSSS